MARRMLAQGLLPEEIVRKFGHISLAQVHAALAYYHANRDEIERDLAEEDAQLDYWLALARDAETKR